MRRLWGLMLLAVLAASLPASIPVAARDIEAIAGKAAVVPLARVPARLVLADQNIATARGSGDGVFYRPRGGGNQLGGE